MPAGRAARLPPSTRLAIARTWLSVYPAIGPEAMCRSPRPLRVIPALEKSTLNTAASNWPAKTPAAVVVGSVSDFASTPGMPVPGRKLWIARKLVKVSEKPWTGSPMVMPVGNSVGKFDCRIDAGLWPFGGAPQPPGVTVKYGPLLFGWLTVMLHVLLVALILCASVTLIENGYDPAVVVVPLIRPLFMFRFSTGGRLPPASENVTGCAPPLDVTDALNAVPTVPVALVTPPQETVGGPTTLRLQVPLVEVAPLLSVTVTVNGNDPAFPGTPLMTPVAELRPTFCGRLPFNEYVTGPVPPFSLRVPVKKMPTSPVALLNPPHCRLGAELITIAHAPLVAVRPQLSFTWNVTPVLAADCGMPLICPVEGFTCRFEGMVPLNTE